MDIFGRIYLDGCISTTMKQFPIMLLLSSAVDLSPMQFIYNQVSKPLTRGVRTASTLCGMTQEEVFNNTYWIRLYNVHGLNILDMFLIRLHSVYWDAFGWWCYPKNGLYETCPLLSFKFILTTIKWLILVFLLCVVWLIWILLCSNNILVRLVSIHIHVFLCVCISSYPRTFGTFQIVIQSLAVH